MSNSLYYSHQVLSKPKKCFKKGQKVSKSQDPQPINPASLLTVSLPVPLELSEASEKKTFSNQKILLRRKNSQRYPRLLCQDTCRLKPLSPEVQGKPPTHSRGQDFISGIVKEIGRLPFKNITTCSRIWWVKTGNIFTFF